MAIDGSKCTRTVITLSSLKDFILVINQPNILIPVHVVPGNSFRTH